METFTENMKQLNPCY